MRLTRAEIGRRFEEDFFAVLQMSDSDVAVVAQQSSYLSCFVAMIDVEAPEASCVCGFTYSAASLLVVKQAIIFAGFKAVVLFEIVVGVAVWLFVTATRRVFGYFAEVFKTPGAMQLVCARLASAVKAVMVQGGTMKVRERLKGFTALAGFHPFGICMTRRPFRKRALFGDHTGFAVQVEAVPLRSVLMKFGERLGLTAGWTGFHVLSPG